GRPLGITDLDRSRRIAVVQCHSSDDGGAVMAPQGFLDRPSSRVSGTWDWTLPDPPKASRTDRRTIPFQARDGSGGSGTMDDISNMLNQTGAGGTGDQTAALGGLSEAIQGAG